MIFLKELKMCLRKLAIVDDSLEALGAPKEYQRLRNWIIRIIVGWIVYIFYQLVYTNFFLSFYFDVYLTASWNNIIYTTLFTFLLYYKENVIILSILISAAILGLVLHMCIHLFCKLFLLTLCVKIFTL